MAIEKNLKVVLKLELPRNSNRISGNASINSVTTGGYRTVIAVTKHPEEAPIRTDIVREFSSRNLLIAVLKTRAVLRKSVKIATPLPALEKENGR